MTPACWPSAAVNMLPARNIEFLWSPKCANVCPLNKGNSAVALLAALSAWGNDLTSFTWGITLFHPVYDGKHMLSATRFTFLIWKFMFSFDIISTIAKPASASLGEGGGSQITSSSQGRFLETNNHPHSRSHIREMIWSNIQLLFGVFFGYKCFPLDLLYIPCHMTNSLKTN